MGDRGGGDGAVGGNGARTERDKGAQRGGCEFTEQRCFQNLPSPSPTRAKKGKASPRSTPTPAAEPLSSPKDS